MSESSRPNTTGSAESAAPPGEPDWGSALAINERWLRRVVASRLGEPQAVDEVMQDVAMAAVEQRSPLRDPTRAAVWLYRLAVRHVLIYRRKTGRRRGLLGRYAERCPVDGTAPGPSPLAWLVRDERQTMVQQALATLAPRDADLLMLKYAEGFTARELAERMGASVATIETRLHRARGKLRAELTSLSADFEESDHDRP
jgi:RNA polymerase sigma-70 factor, ECF subfamily